MSDTVPRPAKDGDGQAEPKRSVCIDWYHEGESRTVEVDGIQVTVRLIGRSGRRARIAIEAPAGAVFRALDLRGTVRSPDRFP
jgi:hypothetical protein